MLKRNLLNPSLFVNRSKPVIAYVQSRIGEAVWVTKGHIRSFGVMEIVDYVDCCDGSNDSIALNMYAL